MLAIGSARRARVDARVLPQQQIFAEANRLNARDRDGYPWGAGVAFARDCPAKAPAPAQPLAAL